MKRFLAARRIEVLKNPILMFSNLERIKCDIETSHTSGKVYINLKETFDGTEAAVNAPRNYRQV